MIDDPPSSVPIVENQPVRRLEGRRAIITGGGTGIGRASAERLAAEGAAVCVTGRRPEPLSGTVAAIEAAGGHAIACPGDQSVDADAQRMVTAAVHAFGGIDVLVNNAGVIRRNIPLHETTNERWEQILAIDLTGVFYVTRAALRHMLAAEGDRSIVNIASTFAYWNATGVAPYAAAKGGVVALTRSLAVEYAEHGIRANCICPAVVKTPLSLVDRPNYEELLPALTALHPLGRIGEPEDVAAAVAYLASADAAWVTGVVMNVDGGMTAR
jgi:NAD(P)-dependent dehydrogenase (short-subunit alcohol dehydrogenase family)